MSVGATSEVEYIANVKLTRKVRIMRRGVTLLSGKKEECSTLR